MIPDKKITEVREQVKENQAYADEIMKRLMRNEAWSAALYGALLDFLEKQPGYTRKSVEEDLNRRWKASLQIILERLEKDSPGLAGLLDNRMPEEVH